MFKNEKVETEQLSFFTDSLSSSYFQNFSQPN